MELLGAEQVAKSNLNPVLGKKTKLLAEVISASWAHQASTLLKVAQKLRRDTESFGKCRGRQLFAEPVRRKHLRDRKWTDIVFEFFESIRRLGDVFSFNSHGA
jgi:hypothetical protein